MSALGRAVRALLAPLERRVMLLVSRAVLRLVDDEPGIQRVQLDLLAGETRAGVERLAEYGLTSVPLEGAWGLALAVGGNRDHLLVIATEDRRHRLTGLAPGEVALYSSAGQRVHLKASGEVEIQVPDGAQVRAVSPVGVRLEAPLATVTGDLVVEGALSVAGTAAVAQATTVGGTLAVAQAATCSSGLSVFGDVGASGAISDAGGSLDDLRETYNIHSHPETGVVTGPPETPA